MRFQVPENRTSGCRRSRSLHGFTLIELLIVISIIGVLTSMVVVALADSANSAKISRAQVQIRKINDLIMNQWESFETRSIPLRLNTTAFPQLRNPRNAARLRLYAIRELMRLELPDRFTDIIGRDVNLANPLTSGTIDVVVPMDDGTTVQFNLGTNPVNSYLRRELAAVPGRTTQFQGAECLYLILRSIQDEYGNGLDAFSDSEIGDFDDDGLFEILDPWGQPIEFLRWAPGFSEIAPDYEGVLGQWSSPPAPPDTVYPTTRTRSPIQSGNPATDPDPFDPFNADPRLLPGEGNLRNDTFRLVPLIYSAGPDRSYDVWRRDEEDADFHDFGSGFTVVNYATTPPMSATLLNDPFAGRGLGAAPANDDTPSVGFRIDIDNDGLEGYYDNIDNHFGLEE